MSLSKAMAKEKQFNMDIPAVGLALLLPTARCESRVNTSFLTPAIQANRSKASYVEPRSAFSAFERDSLQFSVVKNGLLFVAVPILSSQGEGVTWEKKDPDDDSVELKNLTRDFGFGLVKDAFVTTCRRFMELYVVNNKPAQLSLKVLKDVSASSRRKIGRGLTRTGAGMSIFKTTAYANALAVFALFIVEEAITLGEVFVLTPHSDGRKKDCKRLARKTIQGSGRMTLQLGGSMLGASLGTMILPGIGTSVGYMVGDSAGYVTGNIILGRFGSKEDEEWDL